MSGGDKLLHKITLNPADNMDKNRTTLIIEFVKLFYDRQTDIALRESPGR